MRKLTNVACSDQYTDTGATLTNVIESSGGFFNITGADVYMELQYGMHGQTNFTDEVHVPVGGGVLVKGTTGIRFRNFIAGSVATVTAALSEKSEPPIQIAATGQSAVSVGIGPTPNTTLPGSPTDGQQAILWDSGVAPTWVWILQWVAALGKWLFIGGDPIVSSDLTNTSRAIGGAAYATFTNAPSITLPRAGDYLVEMSGSLQGTVNTAQLAASYAVGATAASDSDAISMGGPLPSGSMKASGFAGPSLKTGLAAAVVIAMQAKLVAGTGNIVNAALKVTPRFIT